MAIRRYNVTVLAPLMHAMRALFGALRPHCTSSLSIVNPSGCCYYTYRYYTCRYCTCRSVCPTRAQLQCSYLVSTQCQAGCCTASTAP
eukprot:14447-Heterococcus_DN1.PRE.3